MSTANALINTIREVSKQTALAYGNAFKAVFVNAPTSGTVTVQHYKDDTPDLQRYQRLTGDTFVVGDVLLLAPMMGTKPVVLGKLGGPTDQWNSSRSQKADVYLNTAAGAGATQGSTTDTVVWALGLTFAWALPAGTYTVVLTGFISLSHSAASGRINIRSRIDTFGGTIFAIPAPQNLYQTYGAVTSRGGLSGTVNVSVEYRVSNAGTLGTVSALNPILIFSAQRTA